MDETSRVTDVMDPIELVYREQSERLWRALVLFSGDPDVASDSVNEAVAQAIARGAAIHELDKWIWRAAFNIARGELKRRSRQTPDVPELPAEIPMETVDMVGALAKLTPKQRAAIVLHHYAGYTTKETATIIGSTANAVGVHLDRARKRLRELLGDDDV
jgi:RNA polymerase sigma factor (sigma-70 family)